METMWEMTKQAWKSNSTCEVVLGKKSRTQKGWLTSGTMRVTDKRREDVGHELLEADAHLKAPQTRL